MQNRSDGAGVNLLPEFILTSKPLSLQCYPLSLQIMREVDASAEFLRSIMASTPRTRQRAAVDGLIKQLNYTHVSQTNTQCRADTDAVNQSMRPSPPDSAARSCPMVTDRPASPSGGHRDDAEHGAARSPRDPDYKSSAPPTPCRSSKSWSTFLLAGL